MPKLVLILGTLLLATPLAAQINEPALKVTVRGLRFYDTVGLSPANQNAVTRMVRKPTYTADYKNAVPENVRDALQRVGYFKTTIEEPRFTVVRRAPGRMVVDVALIVNQGKRYRLAFITFSSATAFSAPELRRQFPIRDGDVLNIESVRSGIKGLKDLYCTKGYINFTPIPDFGFDDDARLAGMRVDIDEGKQYRVGKLTVDGEESVPGAKRRLLNAWARYEGTTYRCDLVQKVMRDVHARPNLPLDEMVNTEQDSVNRVLNYRITLGRPFETATRSEHRTNSVR